MDLDLNCLQVHNVKILILTIHISIHKQKPTSELTSYSSIILSIVRSIIHSSFFFDLSTMSSASDSKQSAIIQGINEPGLVSSNMLRKFPVKIRELVFRPMLNYAGEYKSLSRRIISDLL